MSEPKQSKPQDLPLLSETARRLLAAHDREIAARADDPADPAQEDQAA